MHHRPQKSNLEWLEPECTMNFCMTLRPGLQDICRSPLSEWLEFAHLWEEFAVLHSQVVQNCSRLKYSHVPGLMIDCKETMPCSHTQATEEDISK